MLHEGNIQANEDFFQYMEMDLIFFYVFVIVEIKIQQRCMSWLRVTPLRLL